MPTITVLYEDNHLIAVVKPSGVLSQGDKTGDPSMLEAVKEYLKEKYKKPGNVFVGLLHRLDRPVSGIMLFAKTSKGASRLSEQFRNREVLKIYHTLVCGKLSLPPKGVLVNVLGKDGKLKKAKEYADGQVSVLHYEVINSSGQYSLLKISIEGGQFHQIRSQLSMAGFPVVGDVKYGGPKWKNERAIALCATGLTFKTATLGHCVKLAIDVPREWEDN